MKTYGRYPLAISHGKGVHIYDVEGKDYLDFCAGIATTILGHAHPLLKQAILDQIDRLHHCSNLYYIPEQAKLAAWLVEHSCCDKVSELALRA
jgi:acetylornithine/N-succinyldiaminopimelate aminotransferase